MKVKLMNATEVESLSATLPVTHPNELPSMVFTRIGIAMKAWSKELAESPSTVGAFRYEAFARRLTAAEYGRQDAVEWAWNWYLDLVSDDLERYDRVIQAADQEANQRDRLRKQHAFGKSDNPNFQAFLDTLEDPESELYSDSKGFQGWKYLVWIGPLIGAFDRCKDISISTDERKAQFGAALKAKSATQRAKRLGGPISC